MRSILFITFVLCSFSLHAQVGRFEVVKAFDCKHISPKYENMKRLVLLLTQKPNENTRVSVHFTVADEIISNRTLTGTAKIDGVENYVNIEMDKDPYNGSVGKFYWTFRIPLNFFNGDVADDFTAADENMMSFAWRGTPAGPGNNSGLGFKKVWNCRSLNIM